MPKLTKKYHKKRKTKQKRSKRGRSTKRIYKKMKGGVSFNPVFHAGTLPSNTYYELNKYEPDLQRSPELVDARLLPTMKGGKKRRKSRRKRKMKGGSLIGTDLTTGLNTTNTNTALAFGTTSGTKYMLNELTAEPSESGPYLSSRTDVNPNLV